MARIDTRGTLEVRGERYEIERLDALETAFGVSRLPYSIKSSGSLESAADQTPA